jgi:hypothetical protein
MQFKVACVCVCVCVCQGTSRMGTYRNLDLKSQSTTGHWDYDEYHISPNIRPVLFHMLLHRKEGSPYFRALKNTSKYEKGDYGEL